MLTVASALALPAGAAAATLSLDRPCYVSGQPGTVSLSGFSPNAAVTLRSPALGQTTVTTDAAGSSAVAISPPTGADLERPGSREIAFTASEDANPASSAQASARIAPLAFKTDGGETSPKAKRAWYFSGWTVGKPIYAHFRFGGKTRGTHRFGVAGGPCGELAADGLRDHPSKAPGIAVHGRVRAGAWTVRVDQSRRYDPATRRFLEAKTVVFTTYRPRAGG